MLTLEDLDAGLDMPVVTEGRTHQGPPELSEEMRKYAIGQVSKEYVAKFPLKYYHNNTDSKHDRIIAEVTPGTGDKQSAINAYMYDMVKVLNKKQSKVTFVFHKNYLFANPPEKKKAAKEQFTPQTSVPSQATMENFMVPDMTGKYTIEEFSNIPIIQHYQDNGLNLKQSVNLLESRILANPFLPMAILQEADFQSEEEYDKFLFESFANAMLTCKNDNNIAVEALCTFIFSPYDVSKNSIRATTEAVTRNRNMIDKGVHDAKQLANSAQNRVSPYIESLKTVYDKLVGEEAKKEEIIKGGFEGWLLSWRRLYLKLIVVWKSAGLIALAGHAVGSLMGFPWGWILRGILFLGRIGIYIKGIKAMAGFKDEDKERTKRVLINELELELKICREKIDDARSAGDKNAKYQLTRVENSIEQEIKRLKYDLPAKEFHNDKSVFDK